MSPRSRGASGPSDPSDPSDPGRPSRASGPSGPLRAARSPASHLALGSEGERRAARHLARQGYRIVARNVRADGVEIDLVVRRGRTIAFVEVKTRRCTRFGPPELAVDPRKQARIVRGARAWLHARGGGSARVRFDVVACEVGPDETGSPRWRVRHLPGAFDADG